MENETQPQTNMLGQALYQSVNRQVSELTRRYQSHMQCKAGCYHCCLSGFKVTYVEALNVFQGLLHTSPQVMHTVLAQLNEENRALCPLLVDGQCSVYEARPLLCRAFGLAVQVDDTVGTCELNFNDFPEGESVTVLSLRPYYDALEEASEALWQAHPLPLPGDGCTQAAPRLTAQQWMNILFAASEGE